MKNFTALFLLAFFFLSSPCGFAQTYDQANMQLQFINHYGQAAKKGANMPNAIGSEFLYDDWRPAAISFKDTTVRFDQVKLNLVSSNLDVLFRGEEKMIYNTHFRHAALASGSTLVPANRFVYEDKALSGFVEIFGEGPVQVFVHHYISIKPPNPNANIVGGHTVNKLIKTVDNYLFDGERLTLVKKKKDLETYYRQRAKALEQYFKTHKPDIKDSQQLLKLAEQMDHKERM